MLKRERFPDMSLPAVVEPEAGELMRERKRTKFANQGAALALLAFRDIHRESRNNDQQQGVRVASSPRTISDVESITDDESDDANASLRSVAIGARAKSLIPLSLKPLRGPPRLALQVDGNIASTTPRPSVEAVLPRGRPLPPAPLLPRSLICRKKPEACPQSSKYVMA